MSRLTVSCLYSRRSYEDYEIRLDGSILHQDYPAISQAECPQLLMMWKRRDSRYTWYECLLFTESGLQTVKLHGSKSVFRFARKDVHYHNS